MSPPHCKNYFLSKIYLLNSHYCLLHGSTFRVPDRFYPGSREVAHNAQLRYCRGIALN